MACCLANDTFDALYLGARYQELELTGIENMDGPGKRLLKLMG